MKEYKFEKDVWFIIKGETPHAGILKEGESIETINEVSIFEDEDSWKAEKKKIGVIEYDLKTPNIKEPKQPKERAEKAPRVGR